MKNTKPTEPISRAFKRDFPEFVARAEALSISIRPSKERRVNGIPVYWAEGYYQLTGYTHRKDGRAFTASDALAHIDKYLASVEEDRRAMETMTEAERFARVMAEFREMTPQQRMIGEVRHPGGDRGHVWFMSSFEGTVNLRGIGIVAKAKVEWAKDVSQSRQFSTFCDLMESDYRQRNTAYAQAHGEAAR